MMLLKVPPEGYNKIKDVLVTCNNLVTHVKSHPRGGSNSAPTGGGALKGGGGGCEWGLGGRLSLS